MTLDRFPCDGSSTTKPLNGDSRYFVDCMGTDNKYPSFTIYCPPKMTGEERQGLVQEVIQKEFPLFANRHPIINSCFTSRIWVSLPPP